MTKEQEILKYMELLGISREEAEQLWEDDHSDEVLPEVAEMEKKAQKIRRYEKSDAPRKKSERVRKVDEVKVNIISSLAKLISGITKSEDVTILKPEREITFTYKGDSYSITLIKHRPPKNQAVFFIGGSSWYALHHDEPKLLLYRILANLSSKTFSKTF